MSIGTIVDDYITAPRPDGKFQGTVERNLVFTAGGQLYQIRIQRSGSHDYALLMRWSRHKEDWSIVAKRKPSEYGIQGFYPDHFSPEAFQPVEKDLMDMAGQFERYSAA